MINSFSVWKTFERKLPLTLQTKLPFIRHQTWGNNTLPGLFIREFDHICFKGGDGEEIKEIHGVEEDGDEDSKEISSAALDRDAETRVPVKHTTDIDNDAKDDKEDGDCALRFREASWVDAQYTPTVLKKGVKGVHISCEVLYPLTLERLATEPHQCLSPRFLEVIRLLLSHFEAKKWHWEITIVPCLIRLTTTVQWEIVSPLRNKLRDVTRIDVTMDFPEPPEWAEAVELFSEQYSGDSGSESATLSGDVESFVDTKDVGVSDCPSPRVIVLYL